MKKKRFGMHMAACAAGLLAGTAQAAPQAPTATELMDWAQAQLAEYFPGQLPSQAGEGFVFRGPYSSGNFIGVADGTVYVLGPVTGGQLLPVGTLAGLACTVKPASCEPSDALALAQAYVARVDAAQAAEITGPAMLPLMDPCYLHEGRTREYELNIDQLSNDASTLSFLNRKRGSTRRNVEVLDERFLVNSDGSSRREIDARYELVYADGMVVPQKETFVQGSTAGMRMADGSACAAPQVSQELRVLGNRRIVDASVRSLNLILDRFKLSDGTPLATNARLYRNEIRFEIKDPAGVATYATISGPGIVGSAYKMVSPRLLRSAPEFAGKYGNFVDWKDSDPFMACRIGPTNNNYADAEQADCVTHGAGSRNWRSNAATAAEADAQFAGFGFRAGGVYTVKVYNDDGWKTVNGQQGKTPIASYTTTLNRLPASAAALDAGGGSAFGQGTVKVESLADGSLRLEATETRKTKIDGEERPFTGYYFFAQGWTAGSTSTNLYPASRMDFSIAPAVGESAVTLMVPPRPAAMGGITYRENGMIWDDLRGHSVRRIRTFE